MSIKTWGAIPRSLTFTSGGEQSIADRLIDFSITATLAEYSPRYKNNLYQQNGGHSTADFKISMTLDDLANWEDCFQGGSIWTDVAIVYDCSTNTVGDDWLITCDEVIIDDCGQSDQSGKSQLVITGTVSSDDGENPFILTHPVA